MNKVEVEKIILYEDNSILVCHKPAGIAVQSAKITIIDLESAVRNYLSRKDVHYLAIVHRLDQPVEGVLVFAKTPEAARELNRQLSKGLMEKIYWAVISGIPDKTEGILDHFLLKDGKANTSSVVSKQVSGGKRALLEYKILKTLDAMSLIEIRLHTGRHHQIRVQLAYAGMPLLGDCKYNKNIMQKGGWEQISLCSRQLSFIHPETKKKLTFTVLPSGENFHCFE